FASPQCFAKLPLPKCDGNRVGGVRRMALVPAPSLDGTITRAGAAQSIASKSSISADCASGTSSGSRSTAVMPRSAHCREAAYTVALSEICCYSIQRSTLRNLLLFAQEFPAVFFGDLHCRRIIGHHKNPVRFAHPTHGLDGV